MATNRGLPGVWTLRDAFPPNEVLPRWNTYGTVFQTQEPTNNGLVDGDIVITSDGTTGFTITGEQSAKTVIAPLDES
jgi:hypothetical protein